MTQDPYSLCPCGSGKKLKFCCGDILPEMLRYFRLEQNQPESAEKLLCDLQARFPYREVVVAELWKALRNNGKVEQARELLTGFLKKYPDHPRGLVWLARFSLITDGFLPSRRIIHRAFQISSRSHADELSDLAGTIGLTMISKVEPLAGREHMALAVRLAATTRSQAILRGLAMLEGDSAIPIPLRTPHPLLDVSGSVESMQQDQRAKKLSLIGCWEPAAILYSRMAEADAGNGEVWYNLGLCQAWDGRSAEAAVSLHKAATLLENRDTAVDAETLAQLFDQRQPERQFRIYRIALPVHSLSELITRLGQDPALASFDPDEDSEEEHAPAGTEAVVFYDLLDRPQPQTEITDAADFPVVLGDIEVYDVVDEDVAAAGGIASPQVHLIASSQCVDAALAKLTEIIGSFLVDPVAEPARETVSDQPLDAQIFDRRLYCPSSMSKHRFGDLTRNEDARLFAEWCNQPHVVLGNKAPLEAKGDDSLKIVLAASIQAVASNARTISRYVDLKAARQLLGVADPAAIRLGENQHCASLSAFQLLRLDLKSLTNQQIADYCNRVSMLGMTDAAANGLDELLARPGAVQAFGVMRACFMRASIAREERDIDKLTSLMNRARETAAASKDSFRECLEVDIRELAMRIDNPDDPILVELLHRIRDKYLVKLPEVASVIQSQLLNTNCEHLLAELERPVGVGAGSSIWSPGGSGADAPAEGQSLWLPGQS